MCWAGVHGLVPPATVLEELGCSSPGILSVRGQKGADLSPSSSWPQVRSSASAFHGAGVRAEAQSQPPPHPGAGPHPALQLLQESPLSLRWDIAATPKHASR